MNPTTSDAQPAILYLRSSRRCTGLERRILLQAQAARDAGLSPHIAVFYRPHVASPAIHPLIDLANYAGVPAAQILDPSPISPAAWRQLRELVDQIRPQIIHTNDYRSDMLALLVRSLAGVNARLVATCHGHTGGNCKLRFYEAIDRRVLRRFERVIGVSQHQCRLLQQWGLRESQIVHLPNPVEPGWETGPLPADRSAVRQQLDVEETDILMGFFGRHSPEKGLSTLLAAFPRVQANYPNVHLLIAGEREHFVGAKHSGSAFAHCEVSLPNASPLHHEQPALTGGAARETRSGIHFVGHQNDIRPSLAACDLVIVPSHQEAFGLVALEALAYGKPVIATHAGGLPEIIRNGTTCRLVPPNDPDALAEAILEALSDWPATLAMAGRGRDDVLKRFQACDILESMVALYHQMP